MKRILYTVLLISILFAGDLEVNASSGQLRKASIKTCNGIIYGQHSSDNHWHVAEEADGRYYATGDPIYSDPCGSSTSSPSGNNGSVNNSTSSSNNSNNSVTNNNPSSDESTNNSNSFSNNSSTNANYGESNSNNHFGSSSENNNLSESNSTIEEEIKSNDNTLKMIMIDGKEIAVKDTMDYSTSKDKITIEVTPNDEKARYEIKNNSNLKIGSNEITIEVTAEDSTLKTYKINVNREEILSSVTGIKVKINDEEVNFDENQATVYVSSGESTLKIDYTPEDKNAKVEMNEIEKLKTGNNELKIKVTAEDGTVEEFKIVIYKYSKLEEITLTILALAIIGGVGYGTYRVIKKVVSKIKDKDSKTK